MASKLRGEPKRKKPKLDDRKITRLAIKDSLTSCGAALLGADICNDDNSILELTRRKARCRRCPKYALDQMGETPMRSGNWPCQVPSHNHYFNCNDSNTLQDTDCDLRNGCTFRADYLYVQHITLINAYSRLLHYKLRNRIPYTSIYEFDDILMEYIRDVVFRMKDDQKSRSNIELTDVWRLFKNTTPFSRLHLVTRMALDLQYAATCSSSNIPVQDTLLELISPMLVAKMNIIRTTESDPLFKDADKEELPYTEEVWLHLIKRLFCVIKGSPKDRTQNELLRDRCLELHTELNFVIDDPTCSRRDYSAGDSRTRMSPLPDRFAVWYLKDNIKRSAENEHDRNRRNQGSGTNDSRQVGYRGNARSTFLTPNISLEELESNLKRAFAVHLHPKMRTVVTVKQNDPPPSSESTKQSLMQRLGTQVNVSITRNGNRPVKRPANAVATDRQTDQSLSLIHI